MTTKTCQICGQEKPAEAFSKSYPKRCRECVAKEARAKRKNKGDSLQIVDNSQLLPDFLREDMDPQRDEWEDRHYKLALALFFKFLASDGSNAGIAASRAKDAADKFITIMRDNEQ